MTNDVVKFKAFLVDVDGTVSLMCDRGIYEHEKAINDTCNEPVMDVVRGLSYAGYTIVFCTGRFEAHRDVTERWLSEHFSDFEADNLYMRKDGDYRPDQEVKEEIYRSMIEPKYDVIACLDDRNRVVEMWRRIGLTCLQVAPGDF